MLVSIPVRTGVRSSTGRRSLALLLTHNFHHAASLRAQARSREPDTGLTTPKENEHRVRSKCPYYFETGYAGWAKRKSRPFPPPFFSPPSGSFSDPLSTTDRSRDRRPQIDGDEIRGVTIGDDAVLSSENLLVTNDGVGAWAQKERGHAPLWSRLMAHFLGLAAEKDGYGASEEGQVPEPIRYLSEAFEKTKEALSPPNEWLGTTTVTTAILHWKQRDSIDKPMLWVSQLGDSTTMVVRSKKQGNDIIFKSEEQWHWHECPRQLGTNSPDTPEGDAVLSVVDLEEGDIVLTMSDGVTDNLWDHEIAEKVGNALRDWKQDAGAASLAEGMKYVAQEIVLSARQVAEDPYAASVYMERAIEEGLAIEGGKPDDISVVAGLVQRRKK